MCWMKNKKTVIGMLKKIWKLIIWGIAILSVIEVLDGNSIPSKTKKYVEEGGKCTVSFLRVSVFWKQP